MIKLNKSWGCKSENKHGFRTVNRDFHSMWSLLLLWKIGDLLLPEQEVCSGENRPGTGQRTLRSSSVWYQLTISERILRVPLPGCIWIGHIFPESRCPLLCEKLPARGSAAPLPALTQGFVGQSTRERWSLRQATRCLNLCWPSPAAKAICWKVYSKLKWKGNILNESSCLFQFSFLTSGAKHIDFQGGPGPQMCTSPSYWCGGEGNSVQ